jgi:Uma2 family endonuclease
MSTVPTNSSYEPQPVWELATLYPPQGTWTVDEYLALTDKTNRLIEFVDGGLEFLPMPTRIHQRIVKYLLFLLSAFVDERKLGEVLPGGIRVRTESGKFRIPDVIFLSAASETAWGGNQFFEGADLAVEVVSEDDDSHKRDYDTKLAEYAAAGIPEYWIVDPQEKRITVLALPAGATTYVEHGVFRSGDVATSKLLADFAVDVEATFAAANV